VKIGFLWKTCLLSDARAIQKMFEGELVELDDENGLPGVDLLVLFGGEDISPSWYDQKVSKTYASEKPSDRDLLEAVTFLGAVERGIPVLAICRGAQFACVLLGGKLWQHVDNHECGQVGHDLIMDDGIAYRTNSYHHQMMRPTKDMIVLGHTPCLSSRKWDEYCQSTVGEREPEIVLDPAHKVLMVQGHPEWQSQKDDLYKITQHLVRKYLCPIDSLQ